jgi:transcriptional regulator with XRE-family HTH domain
MKLTSPDTLKALMDQKKFSYDRMARYAGCSKSFISHLAAGRKTSCSPLLAENIAEALEVPLSILFVQSVSAERGQTVGTMRKGA